MRRLSSGGLLACQLSRGGNSHPGGTIGRSCVDMANRAGGANRELADCDHHGRIARIRSCESLVEGVMNVFVAGGSGTIGIPLVRALVAANHQVTALTRSMSKREELHAL